MHNKIYNWIYSWIYSRIIIEYSIDYIIEYNIIYNIMYTRTYNILESAHGQYWGDENQRFVVVNLMQKTFLLLPWACSYYRNLTPVFFLCSAFKTTVSFNKSIRLLLLGTALGSLLTTMQSMGLGFRVHCMLYYYHYSFISV